MAMESPAKRTKIDEELSKVDGNGSPLKRSNGLESEERETETGTGTEKGPDLRVISSEISQREERERGIVEIEAEAAEDRGLRQTMEDAWVVLPRDDACGHGKLR